MRIESTPLIKDFKLIADPDEQASVSVRQATEGENIQRSALFAKTTRILEEADGDTIKYEQEYNARQLRRKEAYLTLAAITGIVDEKDHEWFKSSPGPDGPRISNAMSEKAFNAAWDRLPSTVVDEIIGYIHEVNIGWSPFGTDSGE